MLQDDKNTLISNVDLTKETLAHHHCKEAPPLRSRYMMIKQELSVLRGSYVRSGGWPPTWCVHVASDELGTERAPNIISRNTRSIFTRAVIVVTGQFRQGGGTGGRCPPRPHLRPTVEGFCASAAKSAVAAVLRTFMTQLGFMCTSVETKREVSAIKELHFSPSRLIRFLFVLSLSSRCNFSFLF